MQIYLEADDTAWRDQRTTGWARPIPYASLRQDLFTGDRQQIIPFLGAGASLISTGGDQVDGPGVEPPGRAPAFDDAQFARLFEQLGIQDQWSQEFVRSAIFLAQRVQNARSNAAAEPDRAPSAGELAELLAHEAGYEYMKQPALRLRTVLSDRTEDQLVALLRLLAERTSAFPSCPPLLPVASYFNHSLRRRTLWESLHQRFQLVSRKTETHKLIAHAADCYLKRRPNPHYLIVTTNYDRLMECALEEADVPACVVTVDNGKRLTYARFSPSVQAYLELNEEGFNRLRRDQSGVAPGDFFLDIRKPVAIVYKMHGCVEPSERERDSVIISDQDYIAYLEQNGLALNIIPSHIKRLMGFVPLLFLGYSFSDWNVRSLYAQILTKRNNRGEQDYAVVKSLDLYSQGFFEEKGVAILMTGLDRFAERVQS